MQEWAFAGMRYDRLPTNYCRWPSTGRDASMDGLMGSACGRVVDDAQSDQGEPHQQCFKWAKTTSNIQNYVPIDEENKVGPVALSW